MASQKTTINKIVSSLAKNLSLSFSGPWRTKVIGIISLLLGYYLSSSYISYLLNTDSNRLLVLIIVIFMIESIIRFRSKFFLKENYPFYWTCIDNFRIGTTYAIVLEAFKLGS